MAIWSMFFNSVRASLFSNHLSQHQVEGINTIIAEWQRRGINDNRQLAYILATAYHETGKSMQPVREAFGKSDADSIRKLEAAWAAGKLPNVTTPYWRNGFFGRGYVQLTHQPNYARMGKRLGINLAGNPGLALKPEIAAQILVIGMIEGLFTGKKLADYISGNRCDYVGARRIINGTDRAALIAGYASRFEAALSAAGGLPRQPDDPGVSGLPEGLGGHVAKIIAGLIAFATAAAVAYFKFGN